MSLGRGRARDRSLPHPAIPAWDGDPDRDLIVYLSVPVSIALLVVYVVATWFSLRRHREMHIASDEAITAWSFAAVARRPRRRDRRDRARRRDPRRLARGVLRQGRPERVLRRGGDRRDRRERRRARRRRRRRVPRQGEARRRDRARLGGAGRRLPDPGGGAALMADRPARARVPRGRDRCARRRSRRDGGDALERPRVEGREVSSCSLRTSLVAVAFYVAGDRYGRRGTTSANAAAALVSGYVAR